MAPLLEPAKNDSSKKRPGDGGSLPPLPENWDRCHAFLPKKMRYCRQLPVFPAPSSATGSAPLSGEPSTMYCGNHLYCLPSFQSETDQTEPKINKRIPCPLDATHSVFENQLAKHLRKCPAARHANAQQASYYFLENINKGGHGALYRSSSKLEWAQQLALRVLQLHQQVFANETNVDPKRLSLAGIQASIPNSDLSAEEFENGIEKGLQDYHVRSGGAKHIHQQASLVGHLRRCGAFQQSTPTRTTTTILEMGAGRGMTGLVAAGVAAAAIAEPSSTSPVKFLMVERSGSRSKADTILRKATLLNVQDKTYMNLDHVDSSRIHCDLCHVNVRKVVDANCDANGKLIVLAKHLCGAGTDLALKSIEPIKEHVSTCILATCCHGICNWDDYVGREYLADLMDDPKVGFVFGSAEFDLLRRWSEGTVYVNKHGGDALEPADRSRASDTDHPAQSPEDNTAAQQATSVTNVVESLNLDCGPQGLGRACQRLIDYGRLCYLRHVLFPGCAEPGKLLHYVPGHVTPQNAALIASR